MSSICRADVDRSLKEQYQHREANVILVNAMDEALSNGVYNIAIDTLSRLHGTINNKQAIEQSKAEIDAILPVCGRLPSPIIKDITNEDDDNKDDEAGYRAARDHANIFIDNNGNE